MGDCEVEGKLRGFKYVSGGITFIDYTGAERTSALGITDAGAIVGQFQDAVGVWHGFILRQGHFEIIDVPGALETRPNGINNSGQIVGSCSLDNITSPWVLLCAREIQRSGFAPPRNH